MVTVNENIRFYKPNDPYFYEVDNLPLIDLLENDKTLADAINDILLSQSNFATEGYVQNAIGSAAQVDINGDGVTVPNNVVDWVLSQGYGQGTLESLTDVDLTGLSDGQFIQYDADNVDVAGNPDPKWKPGTISVPRGGDTYLGTFGGHTSGRNTGENDMYERSAHATTTSIRNGVSLPPGHYRFEFTSSRGWTEYYVRHYATDLNQILHGYDKLGIDSSQGKRNLGNLVTSRPGNSNLTVNTSPDGDTKLSRYWDYNGALRYRFDDVVAGMKKRYPSLHVEQEIEYHRSYGANETPPEGNNWNFKVTSNVVETHINIHQMKIDANQESVEGMYYFTVEYPTEVWFATYASKSGVSQVEFQFSGFRGDLYYIGGYDPTFQGNNFEAPFPTTWDSYRDNPPFTVDTTGDDRGNYVAARHRNSLFEQRNRNLP